MIVRQKTNISVAQADETSEGPQCHLFFADQPSPQIIVKILNLQTAHERPVPALLWHLGGLPRACMDHSSQTFRVTCAVNKTHGDPIVLLDGANLYSNRKLRLDIPNRNEPVRAALRKAYAYGANSRIRCIDLVRRLHE